MALEKIKQLVGNGGFLEKPADTEQYVSAWRGGFKGKAVLVVFPSSTEQLSGIVKICAAAKIPMVPQGGNTSLVAGATPSDKGDEVIINLSRMNKIRQINQDAFTITAEAGCILQRLQEECEKQGRLFALSIASEGSAELGGIISTNAGGNNVLRYGNMRDHVLGIEVVLPNGEIWNGLRSLKKDNTGYDLKHLFIGGEGTLGIVTAATVKLFPLPRQSLTSFIGVADISSAVKLLSFLREEIGEDISAFELISEHCIELVTKHISGARNPLTKRFPYYLLVEISTPQKGEFLKEQVEKILAEAIDNGIISDVVIAESLKQADEFWHIREHISEAVRKAGHGIHFDISVAVSDIPAFKESCDKAVISAYPDMKLACFGHVGDGNLHYNMYLPPSYGEDSFKQASLRVKEIIYGKLKEMNGSISAEHGIGILRKEELRGAKPEVELRLMRAIKELFDPGNLMNPGKLL